MRIQTALTLILSAILLTACTQNPARVLNKGSNWYGKSPYENSKRSGGSRVGQIEEGPEVEDVKYEDSARLDDIKTRDLATHVESRSLDAPDAKQDTIIKTAPRTKNEIRSLDAPDAVVETTERPRPAGESSSATTSRDLAPLSSVSFEWPIAGGKVISHFGQKNRGESNDGINISSEMNEPIWAAADGVVVYSGNELKGYGNMIILRHNDGWMSAYAHADSISVRKNDVVKQGDVIGYVGKSGGLSSPQLHFGIRKGKTAVDPESYLPAR